MKTKQNKNKRNTKERRHGIFCKPNARRIQVCTLVAGQQWHERTNTSPLALGHPLVGPSRHDRTYYIQSSPGFCCSGQLRHETSRPLFHRLRHSTSSWAVVVHWSALMPKALGSSRKHHITIFPGPRCSPRPSPILRTSRTSPVISHPRCVPQILQII